MITRSAESRLRTRSRHRLTDMPRLHGSNLLSPSHFFARRAWDHHDRGPRPASWVPRVVVGEADPKNRLRAWSVWALATHNRPERHHPGKVAAGTSRCGLALDHL